MNRPKRENFKSHIEYDELGELEFNGMDDYHDALEKYCDELESKLELATGTITMLDEKIEHLEKALDKACALLTYDQFNAIPPKKILNLCMKDWKEFLLNDD